MEVYGATGYSITVAADKVRIRHEHDNEERLVTASALSGAQNNSLSYLAAVLRGELRAEGGSDGSGYEFDCDADSGCGTGVGADGEEREAGEVGGYSGFRYLSHLDTRNMIAIPTKAVIRNRIRSTIPRFDSLGSVDLYTNRLPRRWLGL